MEGLKMGRDLFERVRYSKGMLCESELIFYSKTDDSDVTQARSGFLKMQKKSPF